MGESLRVALLAGTLGRGGAEKQLVYAARALAGAGVRVGVFSLTRGEVVEQELVHHGFAPTWVGRGSAPPRRLLRLVAALRPFRPHIIQSAHFYTNLYARLAAAPYRALAVGALRSDAFFEVRANGRWGPWLLRAPEVLFANSHAARANAAVLGRDPATVTVVPNVVDLDELDVDRSPRDETGDVVVATVARLIPAKRLDRFLEVLATTRQAGLPIRGIVAGDGPEGDRLRELARRLGLVPDGVQFTGAVARGVEILRAADMLLLSSDHEGFANVVLEAMALGLPVVTTPVGEAALVVRDGETGFVAGPDVGPLAERVAALARSPELRRRMGEAGRRHVERHYTLPALAPRLLDAYANAAARVSRRRVLDALAAIR